MSKEVRYHNDATRTPCVLVLDASASMDEPVSSGRRRIDELNDGLKLLHQDLMNDPTARTSVELCIVCVSGPAGEDVADLLMDWTSVTDFFPPALSAGGMTPLGQGVELALRQVEVRKAYYRQQGLDYHRPWIFVISDGEPTDAANDWRRATEAANGAIQAGKTVVFPIGVESDVDLAVLGQISNVPPKRMDAVKFGEFFLWLSRSLTSASKSRVGDDVQLPPTDPWAAVRT